MIFISVVLLIVLILPQIFTDWEYNFILNSLTGAVAGFVSGVCLNKLNNIVIIRFTENKLVIYSFKNLNYCKYQLCNFDTNSVLLPFAACVSRGLMDIKITYDKTGMLTENTDLRVLNLYESVPCWIKILGLHRYIIDFNSKEFDLLKQNLPKKFDVHIYDDSNKVNIKLKTIIQK